MEALYSINRAQFHQLVTHVSIYHEEASPGFERIITDALTQSGLKRKSFEVWSVPSMSTLLGKSVPIDVHGRHVLVDEGAVMERATCHGVLRYSLLAAAARVKEGGRQRYDFWTMNVALMAGCVSGAAFLAYGRRRWGWMRRRPFVTVGSAFAACLFVVGASRVAMRTVGFGLIVAERSHKKALKHLDCVDCIDDVNRYTARQLEELKVQKLPASPPGMPPPPEAFVRQFELGIQKQIKLLEIDMQEVRVLRREMKSHLCTLHQGLRSSPDGYVDPLGLPILPSEREAAKGRAPIAA